MAVVIENNYHVYSTGNIQLNCTSLQPEHEPVAVLFIVHGLGEHQGRYREMALKFIQNNLAVFTFDHRGHGYSKGKKGHARSVEQLVEDVEHTLMKCRSLFLDLPIFLFGHSMGGQVVATYLDTVKSKEVSGAIISSPWIQLETPPAAWQISLVKKFAIFSPSLTLPNGLNPGDISSVKEEVDSYINDPLIHDKISFSLFTSLYNRGNYLKKHAQAVKIPVLVCHGTMDQITDPKATAQYSLQLGENAEFKSWEHAKHEPHHDREKEAVINYYINWIITHLK